MIQSIFKYVIRCGVCPLHAQEKLRAELKAVKSKELERREKELTVKQVTVV